MLNWSDLQLRLNSLHSDRDHHFKDPKPVPRGGSRSRAICSSRCDKGSFGEIVQSITESRKRALPNGVWPLAFAAPHAARATANFTKDRRFNVQPPDSAESSIICSILCQRLRMLSLVAAVC